jgi:uncharacterized protein
MVKEFAKATINQLNIGVLNTSFQRITTLFGSLRPTFTVDPLSGAPSVELDIQKGKQSSKTLEEIFAHLEKKNTHIIVAFDEFQKITSYPEKNIEALPRSHIQHLNNVHFIYSGSQKHILSSMFADARRPFYQSAQFLGLETIPQNEYEIFIMGHFKMAGIPINKDEIEFILEWTYRHTFYVQYFCNRLFEIKMTMPSASIFHAIDKIFSENEPMFTS